MPRKRFAVYRVAVIFSVLHISSCCSSYCILFLAASLYEARIPANDVCYYTLRGLLTRRYSSLAVYTRRNWMEISASCSNIILCKCQPEAADDV